MAMTIASGMAMTAPGEAAKVISRLMDGLHASGCSISLAASGMPVLQQAQCHAEVIKVSINALLACSHSSSLAVPACWLYKGLSVLQCRTPVAANCCGLSSGLLVATWSACQSGCKHADKSEDMCLHAHKYAADPASPLLLTSCGHHALCMQAKQHQQLLAM